MCSFDTLTFSLSLEEDELLLALGAEKDCGYPFLSALKRYTEIKLDYEIDFCSCFSEWQFCIREASS